MRFGLNRIAPLLASFVGMGRRDSGPAQAARKHMNNPIGTAPPIEHRYKTGGPNWLKISICSQKHQKIRC